MKSARTMVLWRTPTEAAMKASWKIRLEFANIVLAARRTLGMILPDVSLDRGNGIVHGSGLRGLRGEQSGINI